MQGSQPFQAVREEGLPSVCRRGIQSSQGSHRIQGSSGGMPGVSETEGQYSGKRGSREHSLAHRMHSWLGHARGALGPGTGPSYTGILPFLARTSSPRPGAPSRRKSTSRLTQTGCGRCQVHLGVYTTVPEMSASSLQPCPPAAGSKEMADA